MTPQLSDLQTHWAPIAAIFSIRSEGEYDAAVERLNALIDEVGTNESHPLYGLLDTLARSFTRTKSNVIPFRMPQDQKSSVN
jgi:hypothetical protein